MHPTHRCDLEAGLGNFYYLIADRNSEGGEEVTNGHYVSANNAFFKQPETLLLLLLNDITPFSKF